jgi:hypothetical protein
MSAESKLEQLVNDINKWREKKKHPREKMPDDLFNMALDLHNQYPRLNVAYKAKIPSERWKLALKNRNKIKKDTASQQISRHTEFVEIESPIIKNVQNYCILEIELPSGIKLRLK